MRKLDQPEIHQAVCHGLTRYWSPEQIAGRLKLDDSEGEVPLSARTIYSWIQHDEYRKHWQSFLRRRGKRPFHRKKPAGIGAPIKNRPEVIEKRLRLGDFEGDTVLGPPGRGGLATLVDRKSRYTIVVKVRSKDANHVHRKIKERVKQLHEEKRRSITFDNGTECPADCNKPVSLERVGAYARCRKRQFAKCVRWGTPRSVVPERKGAKEGVSELANSVLLTALGVSPGVFSLHMSIPSDLVPFLFRNWG